LELWFAESHTQGGRFSIQVNRHLFSGNSEHQRIDVFESETYGRFLALDGRMRLTERDEFIYHEMLVHVPMAVHPKPEKVLVIGAGDGGALRELAKYEDIHEMDLVEIDQMVVDVCREYLPGTASGLEDPRLKITYQNGLKAIRGMEGEYDVILIDSTDPFGPGEGLFTKEFYGSCYNALREGGIMVNQHESPFYEEDSRMIQTAHKRILEIFPEVKLYQAHIPTYPSGYWLFGFASKGLHPVDDLRDQAWQEKGIQTRYYNTRLHRGAFALPNYVEELLKDVE
jgi:spermidine synthase